MTKLLEDAFAEARKLPAAEQEALGAWILAELASEKRWAKALRESSRALELLADEAAAERDRGETEPLDPQRLF
jgi:hypothetical protein